MTCLKLTTSCTTLEEVVLGVILHSPQVHKRSEAMSEVYIMFNIVMSWQTVEVRKSVKKQHAMVIFFSLQITQDFL